MPSVDYYPVRKFSGAQPCHGREEFSQFLARWLGCLVSLGMGGSGADRVGDDRVLVCASGL
jgi:hypothetical protein